MDKGAEYYSRYLDGDDEGLVLLVRDYKDGLIMYLNGICKNAHTAEDLCEDTFVRLVTKRPVYNGKASFKTWLYTIGRHVAYDELRKRRDTVSTDGLVLPDGIPLEEKYAADEQCSPLQSGRRDPSPTGLPSRSDSDGNSRREARVKKF